MNYVYLKPIMTKCEMAFACGKQWTSLFETSRADARSCADCKKDVFMVRTHDEAAVAFSLKRCVGIADDNDIIGMVGELGPGGFDWMDAEPQIVHVQLACPIADQRVSQLTREFPVLFDAPDLRSSLLEGERVRLGEFESGRIDVVLNELRTRAPELVATVEAKTC